MCMMLVVNVTKRNEGEGRIVSSTHRYLAVALTASHHQCAIDGHRQRSNLRSSPLSSHKTKNQMGNLCSKVDSTTTVENTSPTKTAPTTTKVKTTTTTTKKKKMTKIAIVYYSMYGHIATMAEAVAKGIKDGGAEVDIYQVPETLPTEVLTKMSAPPKNTDHKVIEDPSTLTEYDGIMFGISGRYGSYSAQIKSFMDSTGGLWMKGALAGKPAGVFQSTGTQGGGQETIGLTIIPFFAHHGMVFVPLGYADSKVFSHDEVHGASPYGAGTFAGSDGSRQPSDLEKAVAETQGKNFATFTAKLS